MEIVYLSVLTFIAAAIGTITGFGSSTVMIPFVLFLYPLPVALFFVGIIHTFNDLWKIILFKNHINKKILISFAIPGIILSIIGANLAVSLPEKILTKAFGVALITYFFIIIYKPKSKLPKTSFSAATGGALSGIMAGSFGVGGPARSLFLSAFNLKKEIYLFTSGAIAILIDIPRLLTYYSNGVTLNQSLAYGLALFIPISFLGAELAKKIVHLIPQKQFRLVIAGTLLLIGIRYLIL